MRRILPTAVLAASLALGSHANAGQIWTDGDGDGLPDSGPVPATASSNVTVGVWIDAQSFSWTNFLAYVEWSGDCVSYVSASYVISGGAVFPIDNFSHPRGIGFGGSGFTEGGVDHIGNMTLHVNAPVSCCVTPIIDIDNPYYVFSQLGRGAAYMIFSTNPGTCIGTEEPTGACCFPDGSCTVVKPTQCAAAGGAYAGDDVTCASANCPQPSEACCFADGTCADLLPADCATQGGTSQGTGTLCTSVECEQPPTGACCVSVQCVANVTEEDCESSGGTYMGDNSTCGPPSPCLGCAAQGAPGENGAGSAGAALFSNNIRDLLIEKSARLSGNTPNPPEGLIAGDDIASALPINGIPFSDSRNTCTFNNDYDESCPYTGSTSPDVVYSYTPSVSQLVTFDLCNSGYDTKIYVYENVQGNLVACNDDACIDPSGNPFRSFVSCVNVDPGNTYYIFIDGWSGDCGEYCLRAYPSTGCPESCDPGYCPAGALLEGEPVCGPNYVDAFNGGCNSVPNVFNNISCSNQNVCGASGTYTFNGLSYRDTDWYQFNLPTATSVTVTMCTSFDAQLAVIDGDIGCGFVTIICGPDFGPAGSTLWCGYNAPSGLNWIFVAPSAFAGVACGSPYVLSVDCGGYNATESKTWGQIKGMFR